MQTNFDGFLGYPRVEKVWGTEIILANNDYYCAKFLVIKPNYQCSLHRHSIKTETFYILDGLIETEIDLRDPEVKAVGDCLHVPRRSWHRFGSRTGGVILEVSTPHFDSDVERLEESRLLD